MMNRILICSLFCCLFSLQMMAQQVPIGSWKSYFSHNQYFATERIENKIYFGSNQLVEYDTELNEFSTFSKVNGLNDVNIQTLRFDPLSGFMIITYENANIDLFKDEIFYNISDIKNLNIIGSKQINSVFFKNQLMYLCTDFGIVVLNPIKKEIKETYTLQLNGGLAAVKGLAEHEGKFIATTDKGIFEASVSNPNLQNFANWQLLNAKPCKEIVVMENNIFVIDENQLYQLNNQTLSTLYTSNSIFRKLVKGENNFYICASGNDIRALTVFDKLGNKTDSITSVNPYDVVEKGSNELWVADFWEGGVRLRNKTQKDVINPKSIYNNSIYNMKYYLGDILITAGGESAWQLTYNSGGISRLNKAGDWTWYNRFNNTSGLDQVVDILDIAVDKRDGTIYGASYADGLWEWHTDNTSVQYKNTDYIQPYGGTNRVAGLIFDANNNLWIANYAADHQLVVKKADGSWQKFALPYSVVEKTASHIEIDDINQKWIVAPRGVGIFVYNDNNTIDNKNDDKAKLLKPGAGTGNLPSDNVNCIEKDKQGKMWVGTNDGIAIFNCPENIFGIGGCDAELKVVKYDVDAGLLFKGENVISIATDGANNKWIGTNNGIWQISDDAEKILNRFTTKNSPLPSNDITKIVVHPETGEVFIGTEKGLISYRASATDGSASNDDILIFPNPVASSYSGTIAIKGLVENADVRITDVSGQLVFRTKAQGGQAVWNGKNYTGNRPRTGIYYVFVTNEDGSQTKSSKFIFNE